MGLGDIALTPDGKILIVSSDGGEVKICNVPKKEVVHTFKAHASKIWACQVSPDGKRFATLANDNIIKLWDVDSGKESRSWNMNMPAQDSPVVAYSLAFSPDGKQLVTGNANTTLFVLDLP